MISIDEVRKLALLARTDMADNELEELRGQLDEILGFVGEVAKADVSSVPALTMPIPYNTFREDGVPHETGEFTNAIVSNFPDQDNGFLRVKKILEK